MNDLDLKIVELSGRNLVGLILSRDKALRPNKYETKLIKINKVSNKGPKKSL